MREYGVGRAPGAAGELVQGQFQDGRDFLISLPVDMWSEVHITLDDSSPDFRLVQPDKQKTAQAVRAFLDMRGMEHVGGEIYINSDIPVGKGMASSTADITAACRAAGNALGMNVPPKTIADIARNIEPSDGIMYPSLVCFDHLHGEMIEPLGDVPIMDVLIIDLGGTVDTLTFNQLTKKYSSDELMRIQQAYEMLKMGMQQQDMLLIGQAGVISAEVNQRLLFKSTLEELIAFADEKGALGICVAHSGTVISYLFEPDSEQIHTAKGKFRCLGYNTEIISTTSVV